MANKKKMVMKLNSCRIAAIGVERGLQGQVFNIVFTLQLNFNNA